MLLGGALWLQIHASLFAWDEAQSLHGWSRCSHSPRPPRHRRSATHLEHGSEACAVRGRWLLAEIPPLQQLRQWPNKAACRAHRWRGHPFLCLWAAVWQPNDSWPRAWACKLLLKLQAARSAHGAQGKTATRRHAKSQSWLGNAPAMCSEQLVLWWHSSVLRWQLLWRQSLLAPKHPSEAHAVAVLVCTDSLDVAIAAPRLLEIGQRVQTWQRVCVGLQHWQFGRLAAWWGLWSNAPGVAQPFHRHEWVHPWGVQRKRSCQIPAQLQVGEQCWCLCPLPADT